MIPMYTVQFPKLGWEFQINPVAFTIGNLEIRWYGILITAGFLLAFFYALASCKKMRINEDKLINCVIVGMICGVIGARLYYVIFYPGSDYIENPMAIFDLRKGGLGIYGGIIGGLLGGAITAKICHLRIPPILDLASLGFLIGQCIGRWGNFVNQEAFGGATSLPWGMQSAATELVVPNSPVHPCFLYESLWCLLGFLLLHTFTRKFRKYDGQTFLLYLLWYGVGRFFIEGLRQDSLLTPFLGLRVSQVVAAATVIISLVLLLVFSKKTSLTGCGSRKIMLMNSIIDETPVEDDGKSTIFGDIDPSELNLSEEDALAEKTDADDEMEKSIDHDEEKEESVSDELVEEEIPAGALADDTEASEEEALEEIREEKE